MGGRAAAISHFLFFAFFEILLLQLLYFSKSSVINFSRKIYDFLVSKWGDFSEMGFFVKK